MIPKSRKFPLRTEFLEFRRRANRQTAPHFQLLFLPHTYIPSSDLSAVRRGAKDRSELQAISRLAVIIPKKLNKRATTRNWLRRLTYNALWPFLQDKNLDCVVLYKPIKLEKSPETKQQIISEFSSFKIVKNQKDSPQQETWPTAKLGRQRREVSPFSK